VVTASIDGTARVWRADGTDTPVVLKGHTEAVWQAAYSPDGQFIVTASDDGTARVWQVGWKSLLTTLRERTTACLTKAQRIHYLFEDDQTAQEKSESCERRYGRLP
jgi:WD40 repeat protein